MSIETRVRDYILANYDLSNIEIYRNDYEIDLDDLIEATIETINENVDPDCQYDDTSDDYDVQYIGDEILTLFTSAKSYSPAVTYDHDCNRYTIVVIE